MTDMEKKLLADLAQVWRLDETLLPRVTEDTPFFVPPGEERRGDLLFDLDSLDFMDMLTVLEDDWGIRDVSPEERRTLTTLRNMAALIEKRRADGEKEP